MVRFCSLAFWLGAVNGLRDCFAIRATRAIDSRYAILVGCLRKHAPSALFVGFRGITDGALVLSQRRRVPCQRLRSPTACRLTLFEWIRGCLWFAFAAIASIPLLPSLATVSGVCSALFPLLSLSLCETRVSTRAGYADIVEIVPNGLSTCHHSYVHVQMNSGKRWTEFVPVEQRCGESTIVALPECVVV